MSTVRYNLLNVAGYAPYCGNDKCPSMMPRTRFDGQQFVCSCGWRSQFPTDFIGKYRDRWSLPFATGDVAAILAEAEAVDARMNAEARAPTGDDYNDLYDIIRRARQVLKGSAT